MELSDKILGWEEAKEKDLVEYLESLGYKEQYKSGNEYYYISMLPDRNENTPSFCVNKKKNLWFDHGKTTGKKGGTIIDFGTEYYKCTRPEFLRILSGVEWRMPIVSHPSPAQSDDPAPKIIIVGDKEIQNPYLISYLNSRRIPLNVAQLYCREIHFKFKEKVYYAVGHRNNLGGYELRNKFFKGGSSPKGITFIDNGSKDVVSVEGQFNLLSYVTLFQQPGLPSVNYLILNGTGNIESAFPILDRHRYKYLLYDRGTGGRAITQRALARGETYLDSSSLYDRYDDLNNWHCKRYPPDNQRKQTIHRKLHL